MEHLIITDFGIEHCAADKETIVHPFSHHVLHFVFRGSGYLNGHRISEGEMFICRGGEYSYYYPDPEDPWYYGWIGGSGQLFEQLIAGMGFSDTCHVRTIRKSALIEILIRAGTSSTEQEFRCGLFYAAAGLQIAEMEKAVLSAPEIHVRDAVQYIESMSGAVTADGVSRKMNLSRAYLRNLFTEIYGVSLQEFIMRTRMQRAAELLSSTAYSVAYIGQQVGYHDQMMFSKMFRRYQNQSPTEFRNNTRVFSRIVAEAQQNDPRYQGENIDTLRDRMLSDD